MAVSGVRSSCETLATKSRRIRSARLQIGDVVEHQDRAPSGRDDWRHPGDQVVRRSSRLTASSKARAEPAGQHLGELLDDARVADRLDVRPPGGVALDAEHAARGVVDHLQLAGARRRPARLRPCCRGWPPSGPDRATACPPAGPARAPRRRGRGRRRPGRRRRSRGPAATGRRARSGGRRRRSPGPGPDGGRRMPTSRSPRRGRRARRPGPRVPALTPAVMATKASATASAAIAVARIEPR